MLPLIPFPAAAKTSLEENLPTMPNALLEIIEQYATEINFGGLRFSRQIFNAQGQVSSPLIRNTLKEALMSSYCSAQLRTAVMRSAFTYPWSRVTRLEHTRRNELRKIFNEIAIAGYRTIMQGADLSKLALSNLNWEGADFRGADISGATLININMIDADLSNIKLDQARLVSVDLRCATLTNVDLRKLTEQANVDLAGVIR